MHSTRLFLITLSSILYILFFVRADVSHLPEAVKQPPVTEVCLGCLCEAISGCNRTATCGEGICGLFGITWGYWSDSGKPTKHGQPASDEDAYRNCVTDPRCAANTVQGYMNRFGQDCNGDGVINCYDHAAIHLHGGYGCQNAGLPHKFKFVFEQCLIAVQKQQG